MLLARDPSTGEKIFFGDFLPERAGRRGRGRGNSHTTLHLKELKNLMPKVYQQLERVLREKLRTSLHWTCRIWSSRSRKGQALHVANSHGETLTGRDVPDCSRHVANEKLIKVEEALERIKSEDIERLFYPVLDAEDARAQEHHASRKIAEGINAVPGAAVRQRPFSPQRKRKRGHCAEKR